MPSDTTSNTPETRGVRPTYALQQHAISRGTAMTETGVSLSATAKKLTAMALSLLPPDLSSLEASFTFSQFCQALGYERGGESYRIFRVAVHECLHCTISIETDPGPDGKKVWKEFTWFTMAEYNESTEQAMMKFSSELADFLRALKWMYAKVSLRDIGQLQSRYAIHLFEMAMSYKSLAGKDGNRNGEWYFERGFPDELRQVMGVKKGVYKDRHLLKQYTIDKPVKEINEAGIGLSISPLTVKQGRKIVAIRFYCSGAEKATGRKPRRAASVPAAEIALPLAAPQDAERQEEKDLARLRERYPDEFAQRYHAALDSLPAFMVESGQGAAFSEQRALLELREHHGIVQ